MILEHFLILYFCYMQHLLGLGNFHKGCSFHSVGLLSTWHPTDSYLAHLLIGCTRARSVVLTGNVSSAVFGVCFESPENAKGMHFQPV